MNRFPPTLQDPPPPSMGDPQDEPHRDLALGLVPVAETPLAATDFKAIPPPLAPVWPKGGQPSYRPKLRPR